MHPKLIENSGLDCYHLKEIDKSSLNINFIMQNTNDLNSLDFTPSFKEEYKISQPKIKQYLPLI